MTLFSKNKSVRYLGIGRFFIAVLALSMLAGCQHEDKPIHIQGEAQGSYYSILYYDSLGRNLQPQFDSILADFDLTASLWVEQSLIRRVNRGEDSILNTMFADMLTKSWQIQQYTDGCFNPSVGKLVNAWGFGFKNKQPLNQSTVDSLLSELRTTQYHLDTNAQGLAVLHRKGSAELDFNAIAQGYSVDMVGAYLQSLGIQNYLIDIGGEVIGKGCKADGSPWVVGIERPAENKYSGREIELAITLQDQSVVTSGNYRKYYEKDGVKYSHTIDPATGCPVNHTLLSASVVEKESWLADAMATAYMVMGLDRAKQFIASHIGGPGTEAVFFIYDEGGEYKTYATPGFDKLIRQEQ